VALINWKAVIYKHKITLKVWLNDKAVGLTKLGKTKRMIGLLCAALKVVW
jgi:hypothetical protein